MSTTTVKPAIGFIGLGDQGLPMATAIMGEGSHFPTTRQQMAGGDTASPETLGESVYFRRWLLDLVGACPGFPIHRQIW